MKLLNKTALFNFLLSLSIIVTGAISFYFILLKFSNDDATEKLFIQKERIQRHITQLDSVPSHISIINENIRFQTIPLDSSIKDKVSDIIIHETFDDEDVPYRMLRFNTHSKLYNYEVIITQSLIESDDLIQGISIALFMLLALYLACMVLINRYISKKIWEPFYNILSQLQSFDILESNTLTIPTTNIDEFNSLNKAIAQMTKKIKSDYRNLKEFTENASHEIQTPLAVIRSKIELMLQSESLTETQWSQLNAINDAATRLSKLNQSLLLLSKIENGQFHPSEAIDISTIITTHLQNLSELIDAKNITLQTEIAAGVQVYLHPFLTDILVGNLVMNAIRHNINNGYIHIVLNEKMLRIENSGPQLDIEPERLFERFKKSNTDDTSIGIGLSLVQTIVTSKQWKLNYSYQDKAHIISIYF